MSAVKETQPLGSTSGKRGYIRICVVCGKQLRGVGCRTKYCPECRHERENKKARHPAPAPDVREIAAQADAAGMSYGQYVATRGGNGT